MYFMYTADIPTTDNILPSTFADDTAALYNHENPNMIFLGLQNHMNKVSKCMEGSCIKASSNKSVYVNFPLKNNKCPPIKLGINPIKIKVVKF